MATAAPRLDEDTAALVGDEQRRIREEEHTDLSVTQTANRMLREWRKMRDAAQKHEQGRGRRV